MMKTVYVSCPRLLFKTRTRENAYGFEEDIDYEEPCGADVLVSLRVTTTELIATIEDTECDGCGESWTDAEQKEIKHAANLTFLGRVLDGSLEDSRPLKLVTK